MKLISIITLCIIVLGLVTSLIIASSTGGRGIFIFVPPPFVVMLAMLAWVYYNKERWSSYVAVFISATIFSLLTIVAYYPAAYNIGSSTDGLVFIILPIFSTVLFVPIYLIVRTIVRLILKERKEIVEDQFQEEPIYEGTAGFSFKNIAIAVAVVFIAYMVRSHFSPTYKDESLQPRISTTNGDIEKSKKLGVFVKELNYCIDDFTEPISFRPYIEKAFRYKDEDSTEIELVGDKSGSYLVGFQKHVGFAADVETKTYHEFAYCACLKKPELPDTIVYNIMRLRAPVGTIKVWN